MMEAKEFAQRMKLGDIIPQEDGSFRVKETATHYIDVVPMIYNWRLCRTPKDRPMTYDRGWCYRGTGLSTFLKAIGEAMAWDGADDTEPAGWIKNALTGEHRDVDSS